ncbi:MAG: hypothetical protein ACR2KB_17800 [Chitinophagaceae bacterium]
MKVIKLILFCAFSLKLQAQKCTNCGLNPNVSTYELNVQVPKPETGSMSDENYIWQQLHRIAAHANVRLFEINKNCIYFVQALSKLSGYEPGTVGLQVGTFEDPRLPPDGDISKLGNYRYDYITTGAVQKQGIGYVVILQLQTACSRKPVASVSIPFEANAATDFGNIGQQAANRLSPLIDKIKEFELKEREENSTVALGNDGLNKRITITPKKKKLAIGEETEIELTMVDCDGQPLKDRDISFAATTLKGFAIKSTTGGKVTPSVVKTDINGKAKAVFKMGSGSSAIINAHYLFTKPNCSEHAKIGSYPIGGTPVMVELYYNQDETKTLKAPSLTGIKNLTEVMEVEQTVMNHRSVFYQYPTASSLKAGFLVSTERSESGTKLKTEFVSESGSYFFKRTANEVLVKPDANWIDGKQVLQEKNEAELRGVASIKYPSDVFFFKGNQYEPAYFSWTVSYPDDLSTPGSDLEDMVGADFKIEKGEKGAVWSVNKITDPESPYKTEYIISMKLDAATENKKAREAMKGLFGVDFENLLSAPGQDGLVEAAGERTFIVKILSPYAD